MSADLQYTVFNERKWLLKYPQNNDMNKKQYCFAGTKLAFTKKNENSFPNLLININCPKTLLCGKDWLYSTTLCMQIFETSRIVESAVQINLIWQTVSVKLKKKYTTVVHMTRASCSNTCYLDCYSLIIFSSGTSMKHNNILRNSLSTRSRRSCMSEGRRNTTTANVFLMIVVWCVSRGFELSEEEAH